jgi:hypothetical protein
MTITLILTTSKKICINVSRFFPLAHQFISFPRKNLNPSKTFRVINTHRSVTFVVVMRLHVKTPYFTQPGNI